MALLIPDRGVVRPLRSRRATAVFLSLAGLLVVVGIAALLLWRSPPAITRLLPEADAIVYADLRPVRLLTHFDQRPVVHSPEYQNFIDRTGISPERDLDRVAFALHRMPNPAGPNGVVGYSEVFTGSFDASRLREYLRAIATVRESYAGHEIDTLPVGEATPYGTRLLRVTVLDGSTVAASNMPSAEQIHAIIDASRSPALVRTGPSLLSASYSRVPTTASAWGIGALALPLVDDGHVGVLGLRLPIPPEQPIVASLRFTTALHVQLELLADGEGAAASQTAALRQLLDVARTLVAANGAAPPAAAAKLLASIVIEQQKETTVLRAVVPTSLLQQLTGSSSIASVPPSAAK